MANCGSRPDHFGAAGTDPARHFVNHLRVRLSLSEIHFDLETLGDRALAPPALWRFVTTPDHLHIMHEDLGAAIDRYQSRFGRIRALRTAPPTIGVEGQDGDG